MLYIKEISKNRKEVKVIYSIERSDIEFIWGIETIKNAIRNGHEYKTVYKKNGILLVGSEIFIHSDYLMTKKNQELKDNLSELPTF